MRRGRVSLTTMGSHRGASATRWLIVTLLALVGASIVGSCTMAPSTPPDVGPPTLGVVVCTAAGASVTPVVAVRPDGVHLVVQVPDDLLVRIGDGGDLGHDVALYAGDDDPITQLGPGTHQVTCSGSESDVELPMRASLNIVDPAGLWIDDRMTCLDRSVSSIDYVADATGDAGDPVELFRRHLTGVKPGDQVGRAGYPADPDRDVRVVRDGEIVALGTYREGAPGRWLLDMIAICRDSGVSG